MQPLRGVRVLELGTYVAVPALGSMLGMLGAEVVKIEPPEGDVTRGLTPWSWLSYNWNKKSVCINLKSRPGRRVFRRLVKESHVIVEGLSPVAVKRLGIGYLRIRKMNPLITYCSIKGFARGSGSSERSAFDSVAQAEGGLMYVTQREGAPPSRVGNPCVDLGAASFGALAVVASVLKRPRRGVFIEVPLFDVVAYWNGYWFPYIDLNGEQPTNLGDTHPGFAPYRVYEAKDGRVFIGVVSDPQWEALARALKLPAGPEMRSMRTRVARRAEVDALVYGAVAELSVREVSAALGDGVPHGRVNDLDAVLSNERMASRGFYRKVVHDGRLLRVALPPIGGAAAGEGRLKCPAHGEHTSSILRSIGFAQTEIELLRGSGAIG